MKMVSKKLFNKVIEHFLAHLPVRRAFQACRNSVRTRAATCRACSFSRGLRIHSLEARRTQAAKTQLTQFGLAFGSDQPNNRR
jgi:hypothetical protein